LAADTEILEWVCNERGGSIENWVGKASDENKSEVQVPAETLAKYVGTYVEQPRVWSQTLVPRVVEITVSGDRLFGEMDGRGKVPLVARSETAFSGLYGLGVEFTKADAGGPTQLFVKHVSGDYRFARKR
jgi:hypothetical protein